jgi:hypothetical protein
VNEDEWVSAQTPEIDAVVQKQRAARKPLLEDQQPNQAAQQMMMAGLQQMYSSMVPQGDTYRSPSTLAARDMSQINQQVSPGTSNNGGPPNMAPVNQGAPGAAPAMPGAAPIGAQFAQNPIVRRPRYA